MNTPTLVQVSGATFRQIDFWVHQGYLRPEGGKGVGHVRDFPLAEVQVAKIMARLVGAGVRPAAAARAARNDGELAPGVRVDVDLAVSV